MYYGMLRFKIIGLCFFVQSDIPLMPNSVFIVSDDLQGLDSVCCIVCHQRLPNLLLL